MVALPHSFNTADVPEDSFDPIPPGTYEAMITESEMKATKDGLGAYLQLKIVLGKGQYEGRVLFERLNIQNKNETAVDIAYRTLKKICEAIGKTSIKDSSELHNKRFRVEIEVEQGKPYVKDGEQKEGRDQNRIKKYLSYNEDGGAAASAASSSSPASSSNAPPWKR